MRKKYRCRKKKSSGLHITFRYLISLLPVCILVVLAYNLLSSKLFVPCANSISCQESLKLKIENNAMGIFNNHKIIPPKVALSLKDAKPAVLGKETALGEKHIYINLTRQRLYAYQGKTLFMETSVATGRWGRTPLGVFKIGLKVLSTRMTGGSGADFYDLPNVTYVMFFYNDKIPLSRGFGFHTAYWHNNFGHTMSHGCINMRKTDAEKLYQWAGPLTEDYTTRDSSNNRGTKVTIYVET